MIGPVRALLLSLALLPAPRAFAAGPAIEQGGVGTLRLGRPVPKALLEGGEAARRYATSFYADAQPLEGFRLLDPPVWAVVSGGPFAKWGYAHPGKPAPDRVKKQAVQRALAGKLVVEMLVVTSPELTTATGLKVGSSWAEVRAAIQGAAITQLPGLWEEPTCLVRDGTIAYFFKGCRGKAALPETSPVIRIVVRDWK